MTVTDRSAGCRLIERDATLEQTPVSVPLAVLGARPVEPSGIIACSQRLPRDLLVRLTALSRQVAHIRGGDPALLRRLQKIEADLDALIQSIYDETALHFASRRG